MSCLNPSASTTVDLLFESQVLRAVMAIVASWGGSVDNVTYTHLRKLP